MSKERGFLDDAVDIENALLELERAVGDGGGSVCDLIGVRCSGVSSSAGVNDCLSLDGEVIGLCPFLPGDACGGVDGLPLREFGVEGDDGLRNGDARGELKDNVDG